jgi:hypothetical protein
MKHGIHTTLACICLVGCIYIFATFGIENVILAVGGVIAAGVGVKVYQYMDRA